MEQSLTDGISGIDNAVRRELETQGSLFSASDTTLDYRDGALVLTASVLPKEVRADETLTLSAGGVSAPMAAGADGVYTAELTLPLAAELTPAVAFSSPAGTRQEALDSLWTGDVLTTAGGLELTDPNPVVTLQQNSDSSGDVDFSPAWEE